MTPAARLTDPDTSHEAAASVDNIGSVQHGILLVLSHWGPCTDEQIAERYRGPKASPSGLRTRRKELVEAGAVRANARKQTLSTGRKGTRWELDPTW